MIKVKPGALRGALRHLRCRRGRGWRSSRGLADGERRPRAAQRHPRNASAGSTTRTRLTSIRRSGGARGPTRAARFTSRCAGRSPTKSKPRSKRELDAAQGDDAPLARAADVQRRSISPASSSSCSPTAGNDTAARLTAIEGLSPPTAPLPPEVLAALSGICQRRKQAPDFRAPAPAPARARRRARGANLPPPSPRFAPFAGTTSGHARAHRRLRGLHPRRARTAKHLGASARNSPPAATLAKRTLAADRPRESRHQRARQRQGQGSRARQPWKRRGRSPRAPRACSASSRAPKRKPTPAGRRRI